MESLTIKVWPLHKIEPLREVYKHVRIIGQWLAHSQYQKESKIQITLFAPYQP